MLANQGLLPLPAGEASETAGAGVCRAGDIAPRLTQLKKKFFGWKLKALQERKAASWLPLFIRAFSGGKRCSAMGTKTPGNQSVISSCRHGDLTHVFRRSGRR